MSGRYLESLWLMYLPSTFTVLVCLSVLFMSKRDERRARAQLLASNPSVEVDLDEDIDTKAKTSEDVTPITERDD